MKAKGKPGFRLYSYFCFTGASDPPCMPLLVIIHPQLRLIYLYRASSPQAAQPWEDPTIS